MTARFARPGRSGLSWIVSGQGIPRSQDEPRSGERRSGACPSPVFHEGRPEEQSTKLPATTRGPSAYRRQADELVCVPLWNASSFTVSVRSMFVKVRVIES